MELDPYGRLSLAPTTDELRSRPVEPTQEQCLGYLGRRFGWGLSHLHQVEVDVHGRGISFNLHGRVEEISRLLVNDPSYEFVVQGGEGEVAQERDAIHPSPTLHVTMRHRGRTRSLEGCQLLCILWITIITLVFLFILWPPWTRPAEVAEAG